MLEVHLQNDDKKPNQNKTKQTNKKKTKQPKTIQNPRIVNKRNINELIFFVMKTRFLKTLIFSIC